MKTCNTELNTLQKTTNKKNLTYYRNYFNINHNRPNNKTR